jgi:hypothetical protein
VPPVADVAPASDRAVRRPGDDVRGSGAHLVVAAGAPVGLAGGGAAHAPDDERAVGMLLDPLQPGRSRVSVTGTEAGRSVVAARHLTIIPVGRGAGSRQEPEELTGGAAGAWYLGVDGVVVARRVVVVGVVVARRVVVVARRGVAAVLAVVTVLTVLTVAFRVAVAVGVVAARSVPVALAAGDVDVVDRAR